MSKWYLLTCLLGSVCVCLCKQFNNGGYSRDPVVFAVKTALSSLNPIELKARIAISYRFPHLSPEMRVLLSLEDMDFSTTFFPDEVSLTVSVNPVKMFERLANFLLGRRHDGEKVSHSNILEYSFK